MRIDKIHLRNIKSYGDQSPVIEFADGVNFLSGVNGAGKSTLIEAIGCALFDAWEHTKENFLRRGARSGSITVWIDGDGETFRVERKLGTTQSWVVYDKDDIALCEKRDDVLRFLRDRFNVDDLTSVFRNIVGVPQGMFTAIFKMQATPRQKIFDGIINVERYRKSTEDHAAVKNAMLPKEIAALKEKIAACNAFIEEHKEDPKRLAQTDEQLKIATDQIAGLSELRTTLQKNRKIMEEIKSKLDALDLTIGKLETVIAETGKALATASEEVKRSKKASEACASTRDGHRAFLEAEKQFDGLDKQRANRDDLVQAAHKIETQIRSDEAAIKQIEEELVKGREKEKCRADALVKLEKERKERDADAGVAEKESEKARQTYARNEESLEQFRKIENNYLARLGKAHSAREQVREQLERAVQLANALTTFDEIAKLAGAADEVRKVEENIRKKLTKTETAIEEQENHKKQLAGAVCPFIKKHCDRVNPAVFQSRMSDLMGEAKKLREELKEAQQRTKTVADAEKKFETLREQKKHLTEARGAIRKEWGKARKSLSEWKPIWGKYPEFPGDGDEEIDLSAFDGYAKDLSSELDRRDRNLKAEAAAERKLAALSAGKRKTADAALQNVERAKTEIREFRGELSGKEGALAARNEKRARALEKKADADNEVKKFASLDGDMARQRGEMETRRPAHQEYVQHERAAAELEKREEDARRKGEEIRNAKERQANARVEREKVSATFDSEQLRKVTIDLEDIVTRLGSAENERKNLTNARSDLVKNVEKLGVQGGALERATRERERLEKFAGILDDIWKILRDLGPRVSSRLLASISSRANRLFGLIHDQPGQLVWGRDYEVRLKQGSIEYAFGNLSGGEQMSAALAIQMAMARDFAGSSFCIFDEPTIHLDEGRRARLAAAIREARADAGFTQVFLVSHDDTFGPSVDHQIRLRKDPVAGTTAVS